MKIKIEDQEFETKEITQLYPAVMIKTGYKDEVTQASFEWVENEGKGKVEVAGYAIFVHLGKEHHHSFHYNTKEELDRAVAAIAAQIAK